MKSKQLFAIIVGLVILASVVVFTKPTKFGLDLAGGLRVVLRAEKDKLTEGEKWNAEKHNAVIRIIRKRVDSLGVAEPIIQAKGDDQIVIELPSIDKPEEAIDLLKSTARMEFRHFRSVKDKRHPNAKYEMNFSTNKSGDDEYIFTDSQGNDVPAEQVIAESPLILTGNDIKPNAVGDKDPSNMMRSIVRLEFTKDGREKFAEFTKRNKDEHLAIILEDKIISAPTINAVILDGKAVIEGNFTAESAQRLADLLNAGALPVPLVIEQQQLVEPTIGKVAIDQSMKAGIIGLLMVIIFMLGYYLLPGFIADIALGIYTLLTLAVFKLIPVTLTLPGIAAFILSIGMAVDANILIFERLKEELRSGKTLRAAIDTGFSRAFTSIFDSNMCTLITCLILYWLGTGPIKGFAVVLGIGVLLSMFTAITVTRTILRLLVNTGLARSPWLFGVGRQWVSGQSGRQLNLVSKMGVWFVLSAVIMAPGIFFWSQGGLKRGIDFTGGTYMQVQFQQPADSRQIEQALAGVGLSGSMVQRQTDDPSIAFVRTKAMTDDLARQAESTIESIGGHVTSREQVSGVISKELWANAIKAVILSAILIVLYLSVRFAVGGLAQGLRFGVCTIMATLHDVLIMIGASAIMGTLMGWEIDSLFVTALLTVIGFSTHDTIVIFDRIRENMRHRARGESFDDLVNKSIMQSFARSINTSLTLILTLVALLVFGSKHPSMLNFMVALLVGVMAGTYSSIFNASQLLVLWHRLTGKDVTGRSLAQARTTSAGSQELRPLVETAGADSNSEIAGSEEAGRSSRPKPKTKKPKRRH